MPSDPSADPSAALEGGDAEESHEPEETPGRGALDAPQQVPQEEENSPEISPRSNDLNVPLVQRTESNQSLLDLEDSARRVAVAEGSEARQASRPRPPLWGVAALVTLAAGALGAVTVREGWITAMFPPPKVKTYMMVSRDDPGAVHQLMSSSSKSVGHAIGLCEAVRARRYGEWLSLVDTPGYVRFRDGDVEIFKESPHGRPVGICWDDSTTTTTSTTSSTTVTSTTTTTQPPLDSVKGDWIVAQQETSCTEVCQSMGMHCRSRSLQAHNEAAADPESMGTLVSALSHLCKGFDSAWGDAKDVPSITIGSDICFISSAGRDEGTFSCEVLPPTSKRRLCFCEDWFASTHAAPYGNRSSGFEPWQIVHWGVNLVKSLKDASSRTVAQKEPCAVVRGRREGNWLRLESGEGFMVVQELEGRGAKLLEPAWFDGQLRLADSCRHTSTTTTPTTTTTSTTTVSTTLGAFPSLYCVSVIMGGSYEVPLLAAQLEQQVGIFGCHGFGVFSTTPGLTVGHGVFAAVFKDAPVGVTISKTAANTELFINLWDRVRQEGKYQLYDWTLKVDPDAVLIPSRAQSHLLPHSRDPGAAIAIANCGRYNPDGDIYGAAEFFSRGAMETYYREGNVADCLDTIDDVDEMGEDLFMRLCLQHHGVQLVQDYDIMADGRCTGNFCGNDVAAVYHPFKGIAPWFGCLQQTTR